MDTRLLARGLRARPTPWLVNSRQQPRALHPMIRNTLRYNSSRSSPESPLPPTRTTTEASTPDRPPETRSPQSQPEQSTTENNPKKEAPGPLSDFDDILNKLDLGSRTAPTNRFGNRMDPNRNRRSEDAVSQSVGDGVGMRAHRGVAQLGNRKTELKLGPTLGRQVLVEPERGMDLASAIRVLQSTVAVNRVKHDSFAQKFHVRRGAMRKQLRRDRWRRLFKFSFQETVKKIQKMRNQGW